MNWRELLRNKKLLWGVGAAAAVGAFVLIRRGGLGGGPGDQAAGVDAGTGGVGYPGMLNTSGTDIAAALGNFSGDLQGQLNDFGSRIEDAMRNIPTDPPVRPPGTPAVRPPIKTTPVPLPRPRPTPRPAFVSVAKFSKSNPAWNSTLSGIASRYKTSVASLLKLNPSIKNPNVIHPGQRIRVS